MLVVKTEERTFVTVQGRGIIAIPTAMRRHFGLDRPGAQVEVGERDGEIVLRAHVAVPADQAWFWTEHWQTEREANDAIAARHLTGEEVLDRPPASPTAAHPPGGAWPGSGLAGSGFLRVF